MAQNIDINHDFPSTQQINSKGTQLWRRKR
jgi:hypothetical protein